MKRAITTSIFTLAGMLVVAGINLLNRDNERGWFFVCIGVIFGGLHAAYRNLD